MRAELNLVDAAAFSVGLIGPVGAIALLGTGAALIIGRAVTLSFVFAVIGVALVAYCFVKLSTHISHTGSVYALVGVILGPRAGFFAGWALMGAFIAIGCGSTIEIGLFGSQFLKDTGILATQQWWWIALIGLLGVSALAFTEIRIITRALLTSEVIGAILVTILSVVILAKVIFSHGPTGQTETVTDATFQALQVGTVLILVAYVLVTVGTIRFLFFSGKTRDVPLWQIVIPLLGGAFVCYTIYRNAFVGQTGYLAHMPYIEVVYLIVGLGIVLVAPGLAGRVRAGLAPGVTP